MKLRAAVSLTATLLSLAAAVLAAEPPQDAMLSFQGFTGVLNTPSAHVSSEGSIHLLYSDQYERLLRTPRAKRQENYLLSVGLFDFFEVGGRLTELPKIGGGFALRDLSASFKVTSAPLTKGRPYWPVLAAGVQDIGGGSNVIQSRYVVVSEDLWRFRLSAGYGFDSKRMQGGFGGVEFQCP